MHRRILMLLQISLGFPAFALEIELRYDIDHAGFFDQPEARQTLRAAADLYERLISDELEAIDPAAHPPRAGESPRTWTPTYLDPSNGSVHNVPNGRNMVVPENTIIIYAASRIMNAHGLGGVGGFTGLSIERSPYTWANQVAGRGEPGAVRYNGVVWTSPTDFAPWGGAIFFNPATEWNFSTSDADQPGRVSFLSVALHEIGHVLGFGDVSSGFSTWGRQIRGTYVGSLGLEANRNRTLYVDAGVGHWHPTTPPAHTIEAFGRRHGEAQNPLMVPTITDFETYFWVPTNLDIASFQDLGWEVEPFASASPAKIAFVDGVPAVGIPTLTGFNYRVERSLNLANAFDAVTPPIVGDGRLQGWIDSQGNVGQGFYRLQVERVTDLAVATAEIGVQVEAVGTVEPHAAPDLLPTLSSCGSVEE